MHHFRPRLLIALLCFYAAVCNAQDIQPPVMGWQHLLDLDKKAASLNGPWEFYWNKLLVNDKDFTAQPDCFITVPKLWNDVKLKGKQLPAQGYATYRLHFILAGTPQNEAGLLVPDFYNSFRLFVNGKLVASDGKVGTTKETSEPHWSSQLVRLGRLKDSNEVILQICNFTHSKGGSSKPIQIGDYLMLSRIYQVNQAEDIFLSGCLFMGGLFFLGLFFYSRNEKAVLFFALFCFMYSYRVAGTDIYALHSLFPSLDYFVTLRLEYITLCLGISFFVMYVGNLYPTKDKNLLSKILVGISVGYGLTAVFLKPVIFTAYINYFLFLLVFYIVYAITILIRAYRSSLPGSKYGIWSCAVIGALFLLTIANYFGLVKHYRVMELLGYITFFFLQALILANMSSYKLNKAKEDAEKGLKAKSQFLSTMSHEIRTPLNAVIGISQLLQKDNANLDDQQKEYIDTLAFSGNNLLAIVNDILDYGKMDANKMGFENVTINIKEIARRVSASLKKSANDKHVELITEIDASIPDYVKGDPTRISQVLMNLAGNAVKFTQKGAVTLQLKKLDGGPQKCSVEFTIQDTGIGISKEKLNFIFDPFTQADSTTSRSYGGTGLGLAITKNILELQGIKLDVKSEQGKGSVFSYIQHFTVPQPGMEDLEIITPDEPAEDHKLFGTTVLLVEDNNINILIAGKIMEKWGVKADVAYNGREAIEKFDPQKHRLILMDLHMPEMDGYEAASVIRSKNAFVPIIALTANVAEDVEKEVMLSGMNSIITKPFKNGELKEVLEKYLS